MKKVLLTLLISGFAVTVCQAQPAAPAAKAAVPQAAMIISGKIKSVTLADAAKGTKPEIIVSDAKAMDTRIEITPNTIIRAKDGAKLTLDKVEVNKDVTVKYVSVKEGINEAIIIKVS